MLYTYSDKLIFPDGLLDSEVTSPQEKRSLISSQPSWSKASTSTGVSSSFPFAAGNYVESHTAEGSTQFLKNKLGFFWNHVEYQTTKIKDSLDDARESYQLYVLSLIMLGTGFLFLFFSFLFFPVVILSPQKFAVPFTLGSLMILNGMGMLRGYTTLLYHFIQPSRCVFSITYFLSMFGTAYTIFYIHSYFLTLGFAGIQVICLFLLLISYITGTDRLVSFFRRRAVSTICDNLGWDNISSLI